MRKFITMTAVAAVALAIPTSAMAGSGYGTQPGYDNASCNGSAHGSFGAFGATGDVRHDNGPNSPDGINGADGTATGAANSGAAQACKAAA